MPNRIIKETINESEGLAECSVFAIDLYKRLISYADDYGRFNADTMIMRARLYPREYDSVTEKGLIDGLSELAGVGKIQFYTPKVFNQCGKKGVYGVFPRWNNHQRIRETKAKTPDPGDTSINDWYLRRFVPIDLKAQILERDNFKCQLCGKFVTSCRDAKRFVKLGSGLYHIDHIVPVVQGGRATYENLRVTCPECNLKRKKDFSFHEILDEAIGKTCSELPQSAATCGELRLESESNPNTNTNPNPNVCTEQAPLASVPPLPLNDGTEYPVTVDQLAEWRSLYPAVNVEQELRNMRGWLIGNPSRRKTKSGIVRFITTWLAKEQDRGRKPVQQNQSHLAPASYDLAAAETKFKTSMPRLTKRETR